MIELRVNSNSLFVDDLYIENENNIAILNKNYFFKFVYCFYDIFIEKSTENKIYFGNKCIDTRTAIFINLLDYYSLFNQMVFKKGNIVYDNVLNRISNYYNNSNENYLNNLLNSELNESKTKTGFDYTVDFEIDIQKIISNFGNLKINTNLEDFDNTILKIIKETIESNPSKLIIIFQDKDLVKTSLNINENVYTFTINTNKQPNIIFSNNIKNFDKNLLISHIKISWPISIKNNEINIIVESYIKDIIIDKHKRTNDYNTYIINYIFSKLNNIYIDLVYEKNNQNIPLEILEYINSIDLNT